MKKIQKLVLSVLSVLMLSGGLLAINPVQASANEIQPQPFQNAVCPISHWTTRAGARLLNHAGAAQGTGRAFPTGSRINSASSRTTIAGQVYVFVTVGNVPGDSILSGGNGWVRENQLNEVRFAAPCAFTIEINQ